MRKKLKNNWVTKTAVNRLYQIQNPILGLTGGIATGKSTVSKILKENGYFIIDADKLVKDIYQKTETIQFVASNFPACVNNGIIDFKLLRQEVFSKAESKQQIEQFIYQRMPDAFKAQAKLANSDEVIIYDVPLLFEKGLNLLVDQSICVYCSNQLQIERVMARDHSSRELAKKIIDQQMPIEDKKLKSDWIIDNSTTLLELEANLQSVLSELIE